MIITVVEMLIGILLIVSIILQQRGTQAGVVFGGSSQTYRSKKGIEKVLFYSTITLAGLFAGFSILGALI
ncbi:MAG: preprotein translocase subunit SecG [Candidatus Levybacteria bacterium RIFCSPHIGHO2_02_FULL_40_18]|nr:MAG: preprotein translocase subunit SecG [Candidatus Levybacteria bacterium RIFCSPHIGHO2_01_FULL_40_58]OGH27307.1 MAG: preprotein translocase subunit SecG [Candidatus Levybacteria bacterium RIFCSPHIGHO2_02_FULL_40_18]OGH30926.1 MAG: preprotein translocase subunit SecG [Candidatus Levybacteria bacterium RIFCSPHIGHO2_12_FULL_40_31]OGH40937.1 MAG: preprotein translocase subunit SecG [Candidatus Levybacteria bacterium RIFCSPLOWO2_01_FULL_40_64]OGH48986.1 MAG: preprotein translocase subunit SecG 